MTPRDAFPGYDDPVNIEIDPEEALGILLNPESDDEPETEESEAP